MTLDEVEITPLQALWYFDNPDDWAEFVEVVGLPARPMMRKMFAMLDAATEDDRETYRWLLEGRPEAKGIAPNRHRHDAEQLARFVEANPRLPERLREVYELCIGEGLTLARRCAGT